MIDNEYKYVVVKNIEEQYSIWPSFKEIPDGWCSCNFLGTKEECLSYVKEHWVDMRPLSLRKEMEKPSVFKTNTSNQDSVVEIPSLVSILTNGQKHSLVVLVDSKDELINQLQYGYLHIKFTNTIGESSLILELDKNIKDVINFDYDTVNLEGTLVLDYQNLKCNIEFSLVSLKGYGILQLISLSEV